MTGKKYKIIYEPKAKKTFNKLDSAIQTQINKKLEKIAINPHIPANRLRGKLRGTYKLKLRDSGFRAIYRVLDDVLIVTILKIGKRDDIYD